MPIYLDVFVLYEKAFHAMGFLSWLSNGKHNFIDLNIYKNKIHVYNIVFVVVVAFTVYGDGVACDWFIFSWFSRHQNQRKTNWSQNTRTTYLNSAKPYADIEYVHGMPWHRYTIPFDKCVFTSILLIYCKFECMRWRRFFSLARSLSLPLPRFFLFYFIIIGFSFMKIE